MVQSGAGIKKYQFSNVGKLIRGLGIVLSVCYVLVNIYVVHTLGTFCLWYPFGILKVKPITKIMVYVDAEIKDILER